MNECPLCLSSNINLFFTDHQKYNCKKLQIEFFRCEVCSLIFKDKVLDLAEQKSRYSKHQNHLTEDYRNFLLRLWNPLKRHLATNAKGLDFGCGPFPAAEIIITNDNFNCRSYDPLFQPDQNLLKLKYDFVFCSEVVEHFAQVAKDWNTLRGLVQKSSLIGIMTAFAPLDFANWHYHRDPTHVSFYCENTFNWIAKNYALEIIETAPNVCIFKTIDLTLAH
jgi:hypothetical protein